MALRPGCPIRKSQDQGSVTSSPGLIAGSYVLHRLSTPRHPSSALNDLVMPTDRRTPVTLGCVTGRTPTGTCQSGAGPSLRMEPPPRSSARILMDSGRLRLTLVSVQYTFPQCMRSPHALRNATLFELLVTCQGTGPANRPLASVLTATSRTSYRVPLPCQRIRSTDFGFFASNAYPSLPRPERATGARPGH